MKTFRIAALSAALVFGVTAAASAQAPTTHRGDRVAAGDSVGPRHRRGGQGDLRGALMKGIQLSDAQKTQLHAIQQKYGEQRRSLAQQVRNQSGATQGTRARPDSATRAQMRSLMETQMSEVRGVLTADQQRTFDQNAANAKATARQRFGGRRANG